MSYIPPNVNGQAAPSSSSPVTLPAIALSGSAQSAPALNYEFLTGTTSGWYDALGYEFISFNVVTGTGITAGILTFEHTNNTTVGTAVVLPVQDSSTATVTRVTSLTLAASTTKQYEAAVSARYVRIRVSTAVTGGTVTVSATLRQASPMLATLNVGLTSAIPTGANTIGSVGLNAGTNSIGAVSLATTAIIDIASAAITTTTTSAAVAQTNYLAASFNVVVTAAAGTIPTLDVVIQETFDGTNYVDLYHFERITAIGSYVSPVIRISGQSIRYVRTITGTTPSFTMSLVRLGKQSTAPAYRSYFDRALTVSQALNATTASYLAPATSQVQMIVVSGAATTACVLQVQGSMDNANWYSIGTATTTVATSVVVSPITSHAAKYIRAIVTSVGVSQTITYINFIVQTN